MLTSAATLLDRTDSPTPAPFTAGERLTTDETGEFFQIYTRTFEDRFFFEIVQRRAYGGFGAGNAPIRLAAQARETAPGMPSR